MFDLVSSAAMSLALTSAALAFVFASTETNSSSSSKSPVLLVKRSNRLASRSIKLFVLAFTSSSTCVSCSSSAFCSLLMTLPNSCSSKPFCVTVKSLRVDFACSSGLKLGLGNIVMKYILKLGSKSIILSLTLTYILDPFLTISFSSTGSSIGSISSSTPTMMRLLPSPMQNSSLSFSFGSDSSTTFCPFHMGRFERSLFMIQFNAWPCGSTNKGKRVLEVTKIPFCVDRGSVGRPSMFQSPIVPTSARKEMTSKLRVTGTLRESQSAVNLSLIM